MYNLSIPQKTVGLFSFQNFDLHVLVGLSAYAALLQLARQENVRSLRRYSWQGMQPPETLPRSSRLRLDDHHPRPGQQLKSRGARVGDDLFQNRILILSHLDTASLLQDQSVSVTRSFSRVSGSVEISESLLSKSLHH